MTFKHSIELMDTGESHDNWVCHYEWYLLYFKHTFWTIRNIKTIVSASNWNFKTLLNNVYIEFFAHYFSPSIARWRQRRQVLIAVSGRNLVSVYGRWLVPKRRRSNSRWKRLLEDITMCLHAWPVNYISVILHDIVNHN